ncbi:MAG: hypothetical protein PHF86_12000 [Candidatus Nanoarchaeia archaeon]|nr:hypothetical protein [Candidatus Nanoarchaeia archaeon]
MPENLENVICYTLNCTCNKCKRVDEGNTHYFIDICKENKNCCDRRDLEGPYPK